MSGDGSNNISIKEGISTLKNLLPYITNHGKLLTVGTVGILVGVALSLFIGIGIRFVIDEFPTDPAESSNFLNRTLIIAIVIIVISQVSGYISGYALIKVATNVTRDLRCSIFNNIINNNLEYIEQQYSGDMQTRIVADTRAVGLFLTYQLPNILTAVISLIVGAIGAFYISVKMALLVLACLPLIFLPFIVAGKPLRVLGKLVQSANADVGRFSGEAFRSIKIIRAYNKEKEENKKFENFAAVAVKYILQITRIELGLSTLVEILALTGFALLLWSSGKDIYAGSMTVGQLVAFAYFALFIVQSAGKFFNIVTRINVAIGTANKVLEYLAVETHSWPSAIRNFQSQGAIEFRNVSFSYPSRPDIMAVKGINLVIRAGAHIALVGSSGAGKSTLFALLLKFYNLQQGNILVDGFDINDLDAAQLRSSIGYVPQKDSLITGSVFENISYGVSKADEASVIVAAKMAHADDFIQKLPQGYNTDLGEVGDRLSGGQKQRISLARALIRNPQILLLDEAKSGLDAESERLVEKAIGYWAETQKATIITIAHRLSTVRNADLIVVMDNGDIVGQGSHEELLKNCALYQRLSIADLHDIKNNELNEAV